MNRGDLGITRRAALAGAAATGAGVLIAPAAALGRPVDDGRVFSHRLGTLVGASPVITAARPFVMAGLQWSGPAAAQIQVRARAGDGRWSPWAAASVRGHEPDGRSEPGALFGEPLWFGTADRIQLRSSAPVGGVRLHFVAAAAVAGPLAEAADAAGPPGSVSPLPLAQPVLPAGPGQPPIINRSVWAGGRNGPSGGPYYGSVQLGFVHHSDNPNGYSAGEVPALILAIYDYHRYTRGYFDIAYNFIIDAFGRIWEGRAGGVAEPVIGAHAGGYNTVSTGVCLLGTFTFAAPAPAAVDALQRLLAWKLSLHGLPTLGKVTVEVAPDAAFYTPFAPGQRVALPRIAGHRDGDLTDCPGTDLYNQLPAIRSRAAALADAPARLTLTASSTAVAASAPVTLSGVLTGLDGTPIVSAPLEVQAVRGIGAVTALATATTGAGGAWSATVTLARSAVLQVLHRVAPASISDPVVVGVTPAITVALASGGSPVRVTGTIVPAKRTVTISVYKLAGPHRRLVLTRKATVRRGRFAARLPLARGARGSYVVIVRTSADTVSAAGASAPLALTI